jgi:hypothetical protein
MVIRIDIRSLFLWVLPHISRLEWDNGQDISYSAPGEQYFKLNETTALVGTVHRLVKRWGDRRYSEHPTPFRQNVLVPFFHTCVEDYGFSHTGFHTASL